MPATRVVTTGKPAGHRFEQDARNAFARKRRQHEDVVVAVERQQTIERNGADETQPAGQPRAAASASI